MAKQNDNEGYHEFHQRDGIHQMSFWYQVWGNVRPLICTRIILDDPPAVPDMANTGLER